jgi:hypothetical protein
MRTTPTTGYSLTQNPNTVIFARTIPIPVLAPDVYRLINSFQSRGSDNESTEQNLELVKITTYNRRLRRLN